MPYQVLPQELVEHLLENEQDEITGLHEDRIRRIKATPCPRCGSSLHPKVDEQRMFDQTSPLVRLWATCSCGFVQSVSTGLVIDRGSAAKVEDPFPIIRPKED